MKTILISGGHLTPALALIDQAKLSNKPFRFIFLGRTYSQETTRQVSQEKTAAEKRNVTFVPTIAPKLHKTFWWRNFTEIRKIVPSFWIAWKTISEYKPDAFLSFGGYLAFPIALVCRIRRVPVITHEQTTSRGMANQVISLVSDKVAVSYESSLELFPKEKTVLTGNPIRPQVMNADPKRPVWIERGSTRPLLYITGGNQGSEILNSSVEQTLATLTQHWFVIHQCGNPSSASNYLQRLTAAKQKLPTSQQRFYLPRSWIEEEELAWIYANAHVVVSRSGANTVQELIIHEIPSVLIPLPFSHNNEQLKNAELLANVRCAQILLQQDLVPESFLKNIAQVTQKHDAMQKHFHELRKKIIVNGAENLLNLIEQIMK